MNYTDTNKLIAEFMGWTFTKREDGNYDLKKDGVESWDVGTDADFKSGATYSGCFSYSEWKDMMPVIEEIYDRVDKENIEEFYCFKHCIPNRDATYKAVVEFIEFYNQNK